MIPTRNKSLLRSLAVNYEKPFVLEENNKIDIRFFNKQPILHIDEGFGLYRDRNPDNGWGQMRRTKLEYIKTEFVDISLLENYNSHSDE